MSEANLIGLWGIAYYIRRLQYLYFGLSPHEPLDTFVGLEHKPRAYRMLASCLYICYFMKEYVYRIFHTSKSVKTWSWISWHINSCRKKCFGLQWCIWSTFRQMSYYNKFTTGTFSSFGTEWPPFYIAIGDIFDIFKYTIYWLLFHCSLFLDVQLTIRQYCFR